MTRKQTADRQMDKAAFQDHIRWHIRRYHSFHLTFLFEAGQGYHVVLHDGTGNKERIGVRFSREVLENSWAVYEILKKELAWSAKVDREVCRTLDRRARQGSILLIVENKQVTEANYHRGELWP